MSPVPDEFCSSCGKKLMFQRVIRGDKLICPECFEKEIKKNQGNSWICCRCGSSNSPWVSQCSCRPPTLLSINNEKNLHVAIPLVYDGKLDAQVSDSIKQNLRENPGVHSEWIPRVHSSGVIKEKIELRSCPFCNCKEIYLYKWNMSSYYSIECGNIKCLLSYSLRNLFETKEKAVEFWNKRAED